MSLGDVLKEAAKRDLAGKKVLSFGGDVKSPLQYTEQVKDGKFEIKLGTTEDEEAYIECSVPHDGTEATQNYCRLYFLSMVFNAAIYGMKRKIQQPKTDKK